MAPNSQPTTGNLAALLKDCLDFYPLFNRLPTFLEIQTWAEEAHVYLTNTELREILRQVYAHLSKHSTTTLTKSSQGKGGKQ